MPFPSDLAQLKAAGYTYLRSETCPVCHEPVEIYSTPGKREIALNAMRDERVGFTLLPMGEPAVRHYETCQAPVPHPAPQQIAMHGVNDKNLLAVGWLDGTLAVQLKWGLYRHTGVPEDFSTKIRNPKQPYPMSLYTKLVGKHPDLYPKIKVG